MNANDILIDLLEDNRRRLHRVLAPMPDECLYWQPDPQANSIAVTIWHMARIFDVFLVRQAQGKTSQDECWFCQGWADRYDYDPRGLGLDGWGILTGYTPAEMNALPHFGRADLLGYLDAVYDNVSAYLDSTTMAELQLDAGDYTRYQHIQMALLDNVRHLGEIFALQSAWRRRNRSLSA